MWTRWFAEMESMLTLATLIATVDGVFLGASADILGGIARRSGDQYAIFQLGARLAHSQHCRSRTGRSDSHKENKAENR